MEYVNVKTGFVIETDSVIEGEDWKVVETTEKKKKENKKVADED